MECNNTVTNVGTITIDSVNKQIIFDKDDEAFSEASEINSDDIIQGNNNLFVTPSEKISLNQFVNNNGQILINAPAINGRETLLKATISDDSTSQFAIINGTNNNNFFMPTFAGFANYNNTNVIGLKFTGMITSAKDISSTIATINFQSYVTSSANDPNNGVITKQQNKPILSFLNAVDCLFVVSPNGSINIGSNVQNLATAQLDINNSLASQPVLKLKSIVNQSANIFEIRDNNNNLRAYINNNFQLFDINGQIENRVNKENTTLDNSTTKYPTNNLIKTYIDNKATLPDAYDNLLGDISLAKNGSNLGDVAVRDSGFQIPGFNSNSNNFALFIFQFSHSKKLNTNAGSLHLHYFLPTAPNNGDTAIFNISWLWTTVNSIIPPIADWNNVTKTHTFTGNEAQFSTGIIELIASLQYPTNEDYSSILRVRIERKAVGIGCDTFLGNIGIEYIDLHYQKNKIGSKLEYSD